MSPDNRIIIDTHKQARRADVELIDGRQTAAPWAPANGAEATRSWHAGRAPECQMGGQQPLILITESARTNSSHSLELAAPAQLKGDAGRALQQSGSSRPDSSEQRATHEVEKREQEEEEGQFEIVDGIKYKLVAAVTKPPAKKNNKPPLALNRSHSLRRTSHQRPQEPIMELNDDQETEDSTGDISSLKFQKATSEAKSTIGSRFQSMRRKSTALVSNFLASDSLNLFSANHNANSNSNNNSNLTPRNPRRMSIYEMTKSPPPETNLEIYLNERRRSSNLSAKQVAQQLEQKSTFQVNYNQRQQYFRDLNEKLINQDKKLLNVVANRGQIHRHSVDIAQLPLGLALAQAAKTKQQQQLQQQTQQPQQQNPASHGDVDVASLEPKEQEQNNFLAPTIHHGKLRLPQQQQHRQSMSTLDRPKKRGRLLSLGGLLRTTQQHHSNRSK